MSFTPIGNITIDGSQKAFNGYVYNLDYSISFSSEPSKLVLNFISEDGTYLEPSLSVLNPYNIQVGTEINQNFYAISYVEKRDGNIKTLEVTFYDGSVILDRLYVGLHRKHGTNPFAVAPLADTPLWLTPYFPPPVYETNTVGEHDSYGNPDNLIIVGNELHPCDMNDDGKFDKADIDLIHYDDTDVCSVICLSELITPNRIVSECLTKSRIETFDVRYKFSELIKRLPSYIKVFNVPTLPNDAYLADHVGSLRGVLNNWCSELGFNFYWENDGLNIVDIRTPPSIVIPELPNIESSSHSKTLEGTVSRGAISHYAQKGQILDKNCPDGRLIGLHCLTLRDLYTSTWMPVYNVGSTGAEDGSTPPPNPSEVIYQDQVYPNGVDIGALETAVVCSYYDQRLRDAYILRNYYGLTDVKFILNNRMMKTMDRFGSLTILKIYDAANTAANPQITGVGNITNGDPYQFLTSGNMAEKFFKTPTDLQNFKNANGFFMLVWINKKKYQNQFNFEELLAKQFFGRHWMRAFFEPYYGEEPQIVPSGEYISASTLDLKLADFTAFNHDDSSDLANLATQMKIAPPLAEGNNPQEQRFGIYNNMKSIVYRERPTMFWDPVLENKDDIFKAQLDSVSSTLPKFCNGLDEDALKALLGADAGGKTWGNGAVTQNDFDNNYVVLMRTTPAQFTVNTRYTDNLTEEDPIVKPVAQYLQASYGLSGKKCIQYNMWGAIINTPAAASVFFEQDGDFTPCELQSGGDLSQPISSTAPLYTVVVVQAYKPHTEIPKVEAVVIDAAPDGNTMKVDYHYVSQISNETIRAMNSLQKTCTPSMDVLIAANESFNENLTFSVVNPFETYEFTVAGIDLPSNSVNSIGKGLIGLSIRVDERGVFSTYKIGNTLYQPVSPDVLAKTLTLKLNAVETAQSPFSNAMPSYPVIQET